jgi:hypothetical protein
VVLVRKKNSVNKMFNDVITNRKIVNYKSINFNYFIVNSLLQKCQNLHQVNYSFLVKIIFFTEIELTFCIMSYL